MTNIAKKLQDGDYHYKNFILRQVATKHPQYLENVELVRFAISRKMNTMPCLYASHTGIYEKNIVRY